MQLTKPRPLKSKPKPKAKPFAWTIELYVIKVIFLDFRTDKYVMKTCASCLRKEKIFLVDLNLKEEEVGKLNLKLCLVIARQNGS